MELPPVCSTLKVPTTKMTYHVLAYRILSREELFRSVGDYLAQPSVRRKKRPRNQTVTIVTVFGATDNI